MILHVVICLVLIYILHQYTYFPFRPICPCFTKKSKQKQKQDQPEKTQLKPEISNVSPQIFTKENGSMENHSNEANESNISIEDNTVQKIDEDVKKEKDEVEKLVAKIQSQVIFK